MKKKDFLLIFISIQYISLLTNSFAGIRPSFDVGHCSWNASNIILATETDASSGVFRVIESWKGHLQTGEVVTIPELVSFASESSRIIDYSLGFYKQQTTEHFQKFVTGQKMVLFLKKSSTFTPIKNGNQNNITYQENVTWLPASWYKNDMWVSVVWFEQDSVYAFEQVMNPGPSLLIPLRQNENKFKENVLHYVKVKYDLEEILKEPDLNKRVVELRKFIPSDIGYATGDAFDALGKCGTYAIPILLNILQDTTMLSYHSNAIGSLNAAGDSNLGLEMTNLVIEETKFWEKQAPSLEVGWWSGSGKPIHWEIVNPLRDRYGKLLNALYILQRIHYPECKIAVQNLRDLWNSYPQLDDPSGLNQMSQTCDNILKSL